MNSTSTGDERVLEAYMETNEKLLLAMAAVPAISGHPIHQGTPREAFCHTFLEKHLAQTVAVSSGEVIDASSRPGEKRSQFDIVIYNRAFPKLDYGGGITGFLSESVIATIEVKSTLNKEGLRKALAAARRLKALRRGFESCSSTGCRPPGILSYVVAYDGPSSMRTVHGWLGGLHHELSIELPRLPPTLEERATVPSPALDGIFVLGKGILQFDNASVTFLHDSTHRALSPDGKWACIDLESGSLLMLFLLLTRAVSGSTGSVLDPFPYIESWTVQADLLP